MMASIPRPKLIQLLGDGLVRIPIVTILGPRQGGKTTLAKEFCKARRDVVFLDLENPADAARLAEPMLYLERLSGLVLLDEVQTVPAVLNVLRVLADRRPLPLRFLLLGSASPELMDKASESLAGRVEFLEMGGFGLGEAEGDQDRLWWRGGFSRAFLASKDEDARVWQQDFISTFLERDLRFLRCRRGDRGVRSHGETASGRSQRSVHVATAPAMARKPDEAPGKIPQSLFER